MTLLRYVCRWFYGDITAEHAKQILMLAGKHGSFLVRTRQSAEKQFALSVRYNDDVLQIAVVYEVSTETLARNG